MNVLRSIVIAFSSFSAIPMPQVEWDEANMRYMMAAFPLIGVVIGLLIWLWSLLCGVLNFGPVLCAGGFDSGSDSLVKRDHGSCPVP